ncbi:ferulic acid esterase A faeA [Neofusicoccum parvum]|uniref:Ferulic acid esterase A faeA n=1 Tax=Neofusicoccum parvum TaxID=310453 RepID=A0ACB5S2Q3_9PEZI|nr:ferulic acid esterase A faeA [Neofusicoccum parvum]GME56665.1 ferulic acid esterase A faeA [Neofusicoccum parvum]
MITKVHVGFQSAYAAVSSAVIAAVRQEACNGSPSLVITGHSLGAAIASIAASSFTSLGFQPTVYTFGEPRNGNAAFSDYINGQISPENYFRVTHANDGVPQIPPTLLGFEHHGTEYWQSSNTTNTPETVLQCEGNEPPVSSIILCGNGKVLCRWHLESELT